MSVDFDLPNCFIVGAAKSGTTFLAQALAEASGVYVPVRKEFHFFAPDLNHGGLRIGSLAAYQRAYAPGQSVQWRVDASPSYLYSVKAAEQIKARVPAARIIILLRNPVQRAYSMYLHNRLRGYETLEFSAALNAEAGRIAEGWPWGFHYLASGSYAGQVERFLRHFPRGAVHIALSDDVFNDSRGYLNRLYDWLSVPPPRKLPAVANRTGAPRSAILSRLVSPQGRLRGLARYAPDWLLQLRRQILAWNVDRAPPLDPVIAQSLREHFSQDMVLLERLLGRELPW